MTFTGWNYGLKCSTWTFTYIAAIPEYVDTDHGPHYDSCNWIQFRSIGDTSGNDICGTQGDDDTNMRVTLTGSAVVVVEKP